MSDPNAQSNIVLIGMPGSGKSTVGVLLAKQATLAFTDTDLIIQASRGRSLQDIVDGDGYEILRQIEEQALLSVNVSNHVIATGGSAVYSAPAMAHLKSQGLVVFLDVSLATVERRIGNFSLRGISKRKDQSLAELFDERHELYLRYADVVIRGDDLSQEQTCEQILKAAELASG
ncbi:MAG: shikimate kinase [Oleiphilaceae bacterium]|nr:shikimate kinase [Oleiphilaceae bacterium]